MYELLNDGQYEYQPQISIVLSNVPRRRRDVIASTHADCKSVLEGQSCNSTKIKDCNRERHISLAWRHIHVHVHIKIDFSLICTTQPLLFVEVLWKAHCKLHVAQYLLSNMNINPKQCVQQSVMQLYYSMLILSLLRHWIHGASFRVPGVSGRHWRRGTCGRWLWLLIEYTEYVAKHRRHQTADAEAKSAARISAATTSNIWACIKWFSCGFCSVKVVVNAAYVYV